MSSEKSARAVIEYEVCEQDIGQRLDLVLTQQLAELLQSVGICDIAASRSRLKRWIADGLVCVDDEVVTKAGYRVRSTANLITIRVAHGEALSLAADNSVEFGIVYEDAELLVIDKPASLVVHPAPGHYSATLVHGLLAHLGEQLAQVGDSLRPGIVHRLDKGTSGLLVVAKTDTAYAHLRKQFEPPRTISRSYLAVTFRLPKKLESGLIDLPIGRDPNNRKKMSVVETGREAKTAFRMQRQMRKGYLIECELETGRTHQIRVHLAAHNAGIVGDPLYGQAESNLEPRHRVAVEQLGRQALHARKLSFIHPTTSEVLSFESALPQDLLELIDVLDS